MQHQFYCTCNARVQHALVASISRNAGANTTVAPSASKRTAALSKSNAWRTRVAATTSGSDPQSLTRSAAAFGTALLLGSLGPLTYRTLSAVQLPPIRDLLELVIFLLGLTVAVLKSIHGDNIHLELHKARLHLQVGVPKSGPALVPDSIVTQATGDVRGNGAYATCIIPRGTHIADYSGELLSTEAFYERYPDGVGDYVMGIDGDCLMDAVAFVTSTNKFHPVHMNHSRHRANVARYYERAKARVAFFALRDILPGEELLYDYGRAYWRGREHLELP